MSYVQSVLQPGETGPPYRVDSTGSSTGRAACLSARWPWQPICDCAYSATRGGTFVASYLPACSPLSQAWFS